MHKVTLVKKRTTYTQKFDDKMDAIEFFEGARHGHALMGFLYINQKLNDVFTRPAMHARLAAAQQQQELKNGQVRIEQERQRAA